MIATITDWWEFAAGISPVLDRESISPPLAASTMSQTPNILILMTDQQRWDALGCSGNRQIRTPNLDALAASGVRFANALTPTPVCVAARMSLITGHRAARTHWMANSALPGPVPELPTIMTLLLRAGYHTQGVGKMHFRGRHYGLQGLQTMEECITDWVDDDYMRYLRRNNVRTRFPKGIRDLLMLQPQTSGIPVEHHPSTWVADRTIDFLREHRRYRPEKPFFLWSSWIAPHPPFAPCAPYDELYDPACMPLPIYADRHIGNLPPALHSHRGRLDGAHRDPDRIRRIRALYYGLVTHIDDGVGRILNAVESLGMAEKTVVIFISDHGEMLGDHGLGQKNCPYEASARIPFLLRWPGRTKAGKVCHDLVALTDILPTLIDEIGLDFPGDRAELTGETILGNEGGGLASERNAFVVDYGTGAGRWVSIRTHTHKYAFFAQGGIEELYDLRSDPHEQNNIADRQRDLTSHLRERALVWEKEHGPPETLDESGFRIYPPPDPYPTEESCRRVMLNDGPWPKRLPQDEKERVETFAEAFTRAISKEKSLTAEKLSIDQYKEKVLQMDAAARGGDSLEGTPWEDAWNHT